MYSGNCYVKVVLFTLYRSFLFLLTNFVKALYATKFEVGAAFVWVDLYDSQANEVVCWIVIKTVKADVTNTIKATQIPNASAISASKSW